MNTYNYQRDTPEQKELGSNLPTSLNSKQEELTDAEKKQIRLEKEKAQRAADNAATIARLGLRKSKGSGGTPS